MKFLESAISDKNHWWRYVLFIILVLFIAQLLGSLPLVSVVALKSDGNYSAISGKLMNFESYGISNNLGLLLIMIPFLISFLFFYLFFKYFHNRSITEVYNGRQNIRWKKIFVGFGVWFLIMISTLIVALLVEGELYTFQLDWKKWLPLVLISLLIMPFQTTIEELLFRGYLAQGIGVWTRNRIVVILIPSILFGLLHAGNPEVVEYGFWKTMPAYILLGIGMALISVLDDGIELAIGLHAANNIFLSIFLTHETSVFQTDALFKLSEINIEGQVIATAVHCLLMIGIFWLIYRWDWSILSKPIRNELSSTTIHEDMA